MGERCDTACAQSPERGLAFVGGDATEAGAGPRGWVATGSLGGRGIFVCYLCNYFVVLANCGRNDEGREGTAGQVRTTAAVFHSRGKGGGAKRNELYM